MFQFLRVMHIVGMAMFFGSILSHVAATLIPGASDAPQVMLAVRQAIVLANWYVTLPGLFIAFVSGALMIATRGYERRPALGVHIVAAIAIAVVAATVLIPAAIHLETAAKAIAIGSMTKDAVARLATREHLFGATNIFLALVAIIVGATLPDIRKK